MIHQPATSFCELRETVTMVYVQRTSKPLLVVYKDMKRAVFMLITKAQAHGIVDLVATE
ncbi:clp protease proteolytic subunit [Pyrus ussuriensis x Pyrus communis]|uniref:Clp protease proteolytic subunit n=1 Tax=Pyrus ussuriensis x Pyrus communis TaxID=2448454 RepID=A0A5N5I2L2_9ROSA|nr:clp protease proteolytic subunit [Pyrus ussuriensis x Pyrus communis]